MGWGRRRGEDDRKQAHILIVQGASTLEVITFEFGNTILMTTSHKVII